MAKRSLSRRSVWTVIKRQLRLIKELLGDRRVPIWMRAIPVVGLVYLFSPIELLPDAAVLPFSLLDDLIVIVVCLTVFLALVPRPIIDDHLSWLDAADITIEDLQDARRRLPPARKEKD
ncbi:MAG TPA: hypothetical protein VJG32_11270 [Anaerolineae bacterium]|nr:hypothetical protein [Anaerolineae bacterium]